MALTTRYFSTAAAGAGDGTSWADRAALFDGSAQFNAIITDWDYVTTGPLEARIGPGTYDCNEELSSADFVTSAPTAQNPLIVVACDSSGNLWVPPNPGWSSAEATHWDDTDMPIIQARQLISPVFDDIRVRLRGLVFEPQGFAGVQAENIDIIEWCICRGTVANSFGGFNARGRMANVWVEAGLATQYGTLIGSSGNADFSNVRAKGNGSTATSGVRRGIAHGGGGETSLSRCVADNNAGIGIGQTNASAGSRVWSTRCVSYGNGDSGFYWSSSGATVPDLIERCVSVGNGAYGMIATLSTNIQSSLCRLRHNTSGNYSVGHSPAYDDITSVGASQAADDAAEFVDAAGGDFRIKYGSDLWGLGIGAGDEPAPAGGVLLASKRGGAKQ